ncbi:uncharacterized protein LOC109788416 isoform X2 [Cajanus cajan]|uniref:uncharacterized protein LOC109788416 isoform X2 n=1 Tax=Cajanus cajan TaxID=3821 RepID=UPI0010FAFBD4|nr:uncharacterized protein LOC109788416 isoform X2 [Cajanus cajan]
MEALNSSCSKAMLGTHVPKSAFLVSNTPKFSFFLNDKKGCDFGFPKLVQNKGLSPLHAVPSKTEDLDNLVLQSDQEQPTKPKTINVKFELHRICNFGEQFLVVGNDPMFGSWNPANAIPMTWSEGHLWTLEMEIPTGKFQFKYILKRREGDIIWQPGPDRIIHTWEAMNRIIVREDWDNAQSQKVTEDDEVPITKEEDQPAPSNNEMQKESEMPNLDSPKEKSKSNATKVMKSKC